MRKLHKLTVLLNLLVFFYLGIGIVPAQTWEPTNGPYGGGVQCLAESEAFLFTGLGGGFWDGRGIFRSADHGSSWTAVNNGLNTGFEKTVEALIFSGSYLVASNMSGIYRSGNNGDNWSSCNYMPEYGPHAFINVGTTLFTGGYDGLYSSTDCGLNWTISTANFPGISLPEVPDIRSMVICEPYWYISTARRGIYRSIDDGVTWLSVNGGLGTASYIYSASFDCLTVTGSDIFVSAGDDYVFRLLNNGTTWTKEQTGLPIEARYISSLLVKDTYIYLTSPGGLFRSNNSGTINWIPVSSNMTGVIFHYLFLSGSDVFAGVGSKGVYLSTDNLLTWAGVSTGLLGQSTKNISQGIGIELLASTSLGNLYHSTDLGENWVSGSSFGCDVGPCLHGTTLFTSSGGDCYRSTDNDVTWEMLPQFYELTWGPANTFYSKGDTIFAGCGALYGVFYSTDNGDSWNATSGIFRPNMAPSVTSITSSGSHMYAGTQYNVFKSSDNGLTWTTCYPAFANVPVNVVAANGANIFAGTENGIFLSTDNGLSWTPRNNGLQNTNIVSLLFNGTDIYAGTVSGIFFSSDNGSNWEAYNQGFQMLPYSNSLVIADNYIFTSNFLVAEPVNRRALSGSAPEQPDAIIGSATPCRGSSQTYSVTNVPGVTYAWQFPSGWVITAGGTTNSVTVTVGTATGLVLVTPSNGWGSGPAQYFIVTQTIAGPGQPSVITGTTNPLEGTTQNYSVVNVAGVSYAWTFPAGWVQTGGDTTNSVSVTVGSGAGNIQVTPSTPCGDGTPRTLAVIPVPAIPTNLTISNIIVSDGQVQCYNATGTIIVSDGESNFLVQSGGQATFIAGQMIQFKPGTKVDSGGYMLGTITTTGQYCNQAAAPMAAVKMAEEASPVTTVLSFFKVYPNPTSGAFTLEINGESETGQTKVEIFSIRGDQVLNSEISGNGKHELSLSGKPVGIYVIRLISGSRTETARIIKQ